MSLLCLVGFMRRAHHRRTAPRRSRNLRPPTRGSVRTPRPHPGSRARRAGTAASRSVAISGGHVGVDPAGRDRIDRDAAPRDLDRRGPRERDQPGLRGGVVRLPGVRSQADDGGDVDDPPARVPAACPSAPAASSGTPPFRSVSITAFHSSSPSEGDRSSRLMPALLTSASTGTPNCASSAPNSASGVAGVGDVALERRSRGRRPRRSRRRPPPRRRGRSGS